MNINFSSLFLVIVLFGFTSCEKEKSASYSPPPTVPKRCNNEEKCRDIACPLFVCPYGNDPLACTCCPTCLKGPGEKCGGPNYQEGRCTQDHICVNKNYQEIPSSKRRNTPVGKCRSRFCPNCAVILCGPEFGQNCKKGTIQDPFCGCCPTCKKGLNEECGGASNIKGGCPRAEGLVCKDDQGLEIFMQENQVKVGKCGYGDGIPIPEPPSNNECPNCAAIQCSIPKCDFGTEIDPICGCCPVCKEPKECPNCAAIQCSVPKCDFGTEIDPICGCCPVCRKGPETNVKPGTLLGYSKNLLPSNPYGTSPTSCPNCAAVSCGIPKCDFGTEVDPVCGCCPVCKKGPGEPCGGVGNKNGNCGDGLVCNQNFRCGDKTTKPGCLDCRLVRVKCRSPESLGCPYDYEVSDCSCCPECRRKSGK